MKVKIPDLAKSEFFRNVCTLISGTTLAQIIPLAIYPALSRLYTPEDFGVFALYTSILTISNIMATAKYELDILMRGEKINRATVSDLLAEESSTTHEESSTTTDSDLDEATGGAIPNPA